MRTILLAAALSISGVAIAQTQPTTGGTAGQPDTEESQPSGETVDDPSQATGPQGITQQGTDPQGQATAPAGTNQMAPAAPGGAFAAPGQSAAFTPRPAAGEYPPCSRTVTDNCVQTYERGVRRPRRGR
jgi:hypothetical protein